MDSVTDVDSTTKVSTVPVDDKVPPLWLLVILSAAIFSAEFLVMLILNYSAGIWPAIKFALVDSAILTVILYPVLYLLVVNPLSIRINKQREIEEDLKRTREELAKMVWERTHDLMSATESLDSEKSERVRSEERLRETEERYRMLFEQSPDGIVVIDVNTTLPVVFNDTACRMLGYSRAEFAAMRIADYQVLDTAEEIAGRLDEAQKKGMAVFEARHRTGAGELMDVQMIMQPVELGRRLVLHCIYRDITVQKRSEEKITRLRRVHTVLSRINEAIVRTRDISVLYREACRIAVEDGQFMMAWIGLVDEARGVVRPAASWGHDDGYLDSINIVVGHAPEGRGPAGTAIREKKEVICNNVKGDPVMGPWRADAMSRGYASIAAFPLEAGADLIGVMTFYASEPGFFDEEEVVLLRRLASNISFALESIGHEQMRKQAEDALVGARDELELRVRERTAELAKTNEQLLLLIKVFESAANALVITDAEGDIEWVNPAFTALTGYSSEEAVGENPRLLRSDQHAPEFYDDLWNTVKAGQVWRGEIVNRRKDGSLYVEDMTITPVRNEAREIAHYIAVKQDITEQKRVEKMKSEFISIVSHELRTPLTSIRGSLGLIAGGIAGELAPQARNLVNIALRNSERLIRLVNDILDVEKMQAGKMVFSMEPHAVMPLVEHAVEINQAYGEQYGVGFVVENGLVGEGVMMVDSDRMMQVMTNLLSNAAKFSPADDRVLVFVSDGNGAIRISVADHGPGIPEEYRDKIFDAFVQVDSSDTRRQGGTGLGLSITRAIVERLGGEIGFETRLGEGTTFYVEFPQWREEEVHAPALSRPRILICEGDKVSASLINTALDRGGFDTDIAYNGDQAKQLLSQQNYAAMVLDIRFPCKEGISLIRELRDDAATRDLPVVVVSGKPQEGREELTGSVWGVIDWLDKPIDFNRLIEAVKMAVPYDGQVKPHILHVEDEAAIVQLTSEILRNIAVVSAAGTVKEAKEKVKTETFDLVILDLVLPDGSGLEIIPALHAAGKTSVPVIIFTGYEVREETLSDVSAVFFKRKTSAQELLDAVTTIIRRGRAVGV